MELMDGTVVPNFGKMGVNSFNRGIQMVREGMANNPEKIKEDAIIEDVLKRAYGDKSIILDLN